ncbi:alpha/beta hydrolase [Sphingomonas crocodyli]|uniref:Alpha/beta fold hydrolase n=1 Tax=Sphingomonas crocodyli TaxID=1979270 RepID=A0A437LWP5_9SPHN|nr:alpha/beta fold hydrolase [Sphingomonas crocodyli]RVT89799.1 alpha/beta fold hydrolase [Sphingomonas crocodyli]
MRRWLIGGLPLLLVGFGATWCVGSWLVRGYGGPVPSAVAPARDIRLTASDGISIAGTYRPGCTVDAPAVLLLHPKGGGRAAMAGNAKWLSARGFATLAIDLRGHGESTITDLSYGLHESRDARAAFDWLKVRQRGAPAALVGSSLGGAAALLGDEGPIPADALVLQAVFPTIHDAIFNRIASRIGRAPALLLEPLLSGQTWLRIGVPPSRLAPIDAVARYRGPLLLIGGAEDESTPPVEVRAMFARANDPRAIWFAPGLDHAATAGIETPAYRARLLNFLTRSIGAPRCGLPTGGPPDRTTGTPASKR